MSSAIVVGAGVFGAATARELALRGWDVTLVEQYSPGTVRSASGGDTRLSRAGHGDADWYAEMARAARTKWLELQDTTGTRIWEPIGVAWFARSEDGFEARSRASLDRLGVPYEWLEPEEARSLYPSLNPDGIAAVLFEPEAGVLRARRATQLLVEDGERAGVRSESGRLLPADDPRADVVVWACGPWLAALFPEHVELKVTRRDVFFFGADAAWRDAPGFCEYEAPYYGHGELDGLGVKVAPDLAGEEVDPDTLDRLPLRSWEEAARTYAAYRFPALAGAPIVGTRVCQYDLSADTHFIVDRHPERDSWWLIGGGSGHGFKHGPAFAEYVADCIEGRREREPFHALGTRSGDAGLRTASHG
ncbi:MAG: FAD-dependent oxidoreductase [Thermoleophilia bacterium]|nr:FAD-dependent oxidoreductase [Thermoleophilia bacterium]